MWIFFTETSGHADGECRGALPMLNGNERRVVVETSPIPPFDPSRTSVFGRRHAPSRTSVFGRRHAPSRTSVFGRRHPPSRTSVFGRRHAPSRTSVFGRRHAPSRTSVFGRRHVPSTKGSGRLSRFWPGRPHRRCAAARHKARSPSTFGERLRQRSRSYSCMVLAV